MNERIEKFSEQARQYADSMYPSGLDISKWGPAYQEKFAELIVRECAQVCRDQPNYYALKKDRDNCAVAIEEHFGVESA